MLKLLLGLGAAPALTMALFALAGCGSEPASPPPPVPTITSLPNMNNVILYVGKVDGVANPQNMYGMGIYLVDPSTGGMQGWAISRPLEEPSSNYISTLYGASWSAARGELLLGGQIGNKPVRFVVGRDGRATDLSLWEDADPQFQYHTFHDYAFSPDGRQIAYNRHDNRGYNDPDDDVYLQDATGSTPRRISAGLHGHGPAWSPDGAHLAFAGFESNRPSIYRVAVAPDGADDADDADDADAAGGSKPRPLVENFQGAYAPAWSPDGKSIAFLGRRNAADLVNIWVMDTEGGGLRSVIPLPAKLDRDAHGLVTFAWSPDSQRFVVLSDHAGSCYHNNIEGGGYCEVSLYLVNADGTGLARLGPYTLSRFSVSLAWLP